MRFRISGRRVVYPALIAGILALGASPALAVTTFDVELSGSEQISDQGTAGQEGATGTARLDVDPVAGRVCYDITTDADGPYILNHIHEGGPGEVGPPVVEFQIPDEFGSVSGCADADPALLADIEADPTNYYVNVHTTSFEAGAVRAQLSREAAPVGWVATGGGGTAPGDRGVAPFAGLGALVATGAALLVRRRRST